MARIYVQVSEGPSEPTWITREEACSGVWLEFDPRGELLGVLIDGADTIQIREFDLLDED